MLNYIDNLTSTQSTFPYNSTDCEKFRSLLISSRGKGNANFLHHSILTLFLYRTDQRRTHGFHGWPIMVHNKSVGQCSALKHHSDYILVYSRYETHYGEEQSRLSREISIIDNEGREIQWTKPLISVLSLRAADQYVVRLEGLFVDEFVYGHAWNAFMTSCMNAWQQSSLNSAVLLLCVPFYHRRSNH